MFFATCYLANRQMEALGKSQILRFLDDERAYSAKTDRFRILMIDDSTVNLMAISTFMTDLDDVEFFCSDKALEAKDKINEIKPSLILLEQHMPGRDGLSILKELQEDDALSKIPVIMLSGEEDAAFKAKAFSVGAVDYMVKFPDKLEFLARLRHHLRQYRLITDATAQAIKTPLRVDSSDDFFPKGMREKVRVHSVAGLGAPYNLNLHQIETRPPVKIEPALNARIRVVDAGVGMHHVNCMITNEGLAEFVLSTPNELRNREALRLQIIGDDEWSLPGESEGRVAECLDATGDGFLSLIPFSARSPEIESSFRGLLRHV
jgi:CheY-like chemotaxis protein